MAENQSKLPAFDAFGRVPVDSCPCGNDDGMLKRYTVEVDKLGNTTIVEDEPLNLVKEIQANKDKCGMVAAKKLMQNGLVAPGYFADRGEDCGDVSYEQYDLPEISQSVAENKATFDELGITDKASLDAYINKRVAEIVAQNQKVEVKQDAE